MAIKNWYLFVAFLLMLVVPISTFFLYNKSQIEAEFLTGMVAASSILLAFLFTLLSILLSQAQKDGKVTPTLELLFWEFLISFVFLLVGILSMFYSALGFIPRVIALSTLMFSFEVSFLFTFVFCLGICLDIMKSEKKDTNDNKNSE